MSLFDIFNRETKLPEGESEVIDENIEAQIENYPTTTIVIPDSEEVVKYDPRLEQKISLISKMMGKAKEVALTSEVDVRVGAVIAARSQIAVMSTNKKKTHPVQRHYSQQVNGNDDRCMLHAEIAALIRLHEYADSIYVARVDAQGNLLASKPCPLCQCAIEENRTIKFVYFINRHGVLTSYRVHRKYTKSKVSTRFAR